jgi:membrane AbrB-like protein
MEPLPLPTWLIAVAQISVGIYMGSNLEVASLTNRRNLFWYTMSGVVSILSFSFVIGFALQLFFGYSLVTAFLGTAPGGVTEMGLTAMMVQADLSVVIAYQMFRLFFVLLVVPLVLKWLLKKI